MQTRSWLAIMMILPALAGCVGDGGDEPTTATSAECLERGLILGEDEAGAPACIEPPFEIRDFEDPTHHCVVTKQRDRVHAPDLVGNPWQQGQSWEYNLALDGEDLGTTKLVYYDDQDLDGQGVAQHYMVGTTTREEALTHALFSVNPMIGRVHRILYSPHESGDHADMFHFPLCAGSSWNTVFYGETFALEAEAATLPLPDDGADEGFLIRGTSAEGSTLALSYSPRAQWFTFIDLDRADGGTVDMQLEATGNGYQGEAFFLRGQQDEAVAFTGGFLALPGVDDATFTREDGNSGAYDSIGLQIDAAVDGLVALVQIDVLDPAGESQWSQQFLLAGGAIATEPFEVAYQAGDWTVQAVGLSASAELVLCTCIDVTVNVVSIYDRSGQVA